MRSKHLVIALSLFTLTACGGRSQDIVQAVISGPATLEVGTTAQYTVTFTTAGSSPTSPGKAVEHRGASWESSNARIATVTQDGVVTAHAPGPLTLRATPYYSAEQKTTSGSLNVMVVQ